MQSRAHARRLAMCLILILFVPVAPAAAGPKVNVKHTPYLQLGDAPLPGLPGNAADQIEVLWQTVPFRRGQNDDFTVEYRRVGAASWTGASPIDTIDTGVGGRVNHFATIRTLDYDADYEYRVTHLRVGDAIATYESTFRTRLAAGDDKAFKFAAYGDSAGLDTVANFRAVQNRINLVDPAFSLLLGDAVYPVGSHDQFDARLDPAINPELTQYVAGHVDYFAMGNHDASTAGGRPALENYSMPVPVKDVTSPVAGPVGETPEKNYSFDYGVMHLATFDSNSLNNAGRLDKQLDWLVADMQASDAVWKVVFVHHPIAGSPDKGERPSGNYYQQVVSRLNDAGVDLFLAGHSHLVHRTFPLLGESGGQAVFVPDMDNDYAKGAGLVQSVSGVGGRGLRPGVFDPNVYPFDVIGFSTQTTPRVEYGFSLIDVTPDQLRVSYVAADDGASLDTFTITVPEPVGLIFLAVMVVCLKRRSMIRRRRARCRASAVRIRHPTSHPRSRMPV